jgi:hypothetical protein
MKHSLDESSAIRAHLSLTFQFLCVVAGTTQFIERGIAVCHLELPHLIRIFLKFSDQLLKPRVADPELPGPIPPGGLVSVTACEPPKCIPSDYFRFLFAAPGTWLMKPRAVDCFQKISDGGFI